MYLKLLEKHIKYGILHLHLADGRDYSFGNSSDNKGPEAHWYIKDETAIRRIARDWEYELGQTYMEGLWHTGESGLRNLLAVLRSNFAVVTVKNWLKPFGTMLQEWNRVTRSYRNVAHHYDVPEAVFRTFLDQEMFYSCAYYAEPGFTLEQAQQAKAAHIARKLLLKPGDRILDIGCGWGSMAFHLAQNHDCEVVGITLSREQLRVAQREAEQRGVSNVRFELCDYREHRGEYDRIVSVGMFEHVGRHFYGSYFRQVNKLLTRNGVALIHTIGRNGRAGSTNPWIHKYIFPGGSTPSIAQVSNAVAGSHLMVTDVEVWRLHYADTLRDWYARFDRQRTEIERIMNAEFVRMWEFYLIVCEAAFRYSDLVVYQYQLAHKGCHDAVPRTRDYLYGV